MVRKTKLLGFGRSQGRALGGHRARTAHATGHRTSRQSRWRRDIGIPAPRGSRTLCRPRLGRSAHGSLSSIFFDAPSAGWNRASDPTAATEKISYREVSRARRYQRPLRDGQASAKRRSAALARDPSPLLDLGYHTRRARLRNRTSAGRAPNRSVRMAGASSRRAVAGIVPIDAEVALAAGRLRARREKKGRPVRAQADMLIAASALVRGITLVTRNVSDFEGCGIALLNPFD